VVRAVHRLLQRNVLQGTEGRHAARQKNHVDVDAFEIHVARPCMRIDADALARERRTLPADIPGCSPVPRASGCRPAGESATMQIVDELRRLGIPSA